MSNPHYTRPMDRLRPRQKSRYKGLAFKGSSAATTLCWKATMVMAVFLMALLPQPGSAQGLRRTLQEEKLATECIKSGQKLLQHVRQFYRKGDVSGIDTPIKNWCLSSEVVEKFDNGLRDHVSKALHRIYGSTNNTDMESFDTDILISDWKVSATSATCENLCSGTVVDIEEGNGGRNDDDDDTRDAVISVAESSSGTVVDVVENNDDGNSDGTEDAVISVAESSSETVVDVVESNGDGNAYDNRDAVISVAESSSETVVDVVESNGDGNAYDNRDAVISIAEKSSQVYKEGTDIVNTQYESTESPSSNAANSSSSSRNSTTTSMLVRLIPVKLLIFLSLMCLSLGIRQMVLSVDSDDSWCCFCKSIFRVGSGPYAAYEGIDPSDISDHQKSVEFELLQLAASGEIDESDVVIS